MSRPVIAAVGSEPWESRVETVARAVGAEFVSLRPGLDLVALEVEPSPPEEAAGLVAEVRVDGAVAIICAVRAGEASTRAALLDAGADDLVTPEADVRELAHRIRRLLEESRRRQVTEDEAGRAFQQQLLFQAVVDALPLSLHAIDRQKRVAVWNRSREAGPFGRSKGEVLGQDLFSVIGEDPGLRSEYEEVFESGVPRTSEVQGGGTYPPRIFRVEKVPMRLLPDGEVSHVITLGHDVTEARSMERSMAQTEKMAAIGRLVAGIAHEINNPLATIAGCAEAMRSRLDGPMGQQDREDVREDSQLIEDEAYRCKGILQNLLDFSRSEPDGSEGCDLAAVVRRTLKLVGHNPRISSARIQVDIDDGIPGVLASEDHLVQVLLALIVNAADAAPEGTITVRTARLGECESVLSVEDDGPGIPRDVQDRVFEPFFTTKPPGEGTGLGLSVAYGLIQAHKGRLEMNSQPGKGTRFDVVLPSYADVTMEIER